MKRCISDAQNEEESAEVARKNNLQEEYGMKFEESCKRKRHDCLEDEEEGVVVVCDRKINIKRLEGSSLYELCRAWVQDDPDRPVSNIGVKHISRAYQQIQQPTQYDGVINYLKNALRKKTAEDFSVDDINSLDGIDSRDILSLHILHFKKKRKLRRSLEMAKYGRLATLNGSRSDNYPLQELIDRLAKASKRDNLLDELMRKLDSDKALPSY